jgi:hypothetical protein
MNPLAHYEMWLSLDCIRCGQQIQVMEIPPGHLDHRRFLCLPCLEERHEAHEARRKSSSPTPVPHNVIPF